MVPICRPTIITVTILKVIECWNSYVWPRLITDDENYFLVSNGIQTIRESGFGRENVPAMMAATVISIIPTIVLYIIAQKRFVEGVATSGMKV
jgi:multiple sugar transport system permease protein